MKFNIQQEDGILKYATEEEVKVSLNVPDLNDLKTVGGESIIGTGDIPVPTGATSLQEITTGEGNNTTNNKIILENTDTQKPSIILNDDALSFEDQHVSRNRINLGNSLNISNVELERGNFGVRLSSGLTHLDVGRNISTNVRISGSPAINPSEFVTKSQLDASSGGGGGSIQTITTGEGNNVSTNAIFVTGVGNIPASLPNGLALLSNGIQIFKDQAVKTSLTYYQAEEATILSHGSDAHLQLSAQTSIKAGANFTTRVSGSEAFNSNEFVTKAQMEAAITAAIAAL